MRDERMPASQHTEHTDDDKGYRWMMGAIVLSMLLCWFGVVTALMIWSDGGEERVAEERVRVTGAPRIVADDSQTGMSA